MTTNGLHSFRSALLIGLALIILAVPLSVAYADNGAFTWQNQVDTFEVTGSCSDPDGLYQITIVSTGTVRFVENDNGVKFGYAENGTYVIEPVAADSPVTYSGQYATRLEEHVNPNNYTFLDTFTNTGWGSDGTHEIFHFTLHIVDTPNGPERVVENVQWICT